jgi:hypothetical protein
MKQQHLGTLLAAAALLLAGPAFAQDENQGQGRAIVTVLPKHEGDSVTAAQQALKVEVNGKPTSVTDWKQIPASGDGLELVVLIDSAARTSLGTQLEEIAHFVQRVPPDAQVAIAYMQNGRADFSAPFSTDRAAVLKGLHLPNGGIAQGASPYFCLSDLAKRWPSNNRNARREVVMISDGVDTYNPRFDPDDPYVQAAISDTVRAGMVVYSLYWQSRGGFDRSERIAGGGQSLLLEVTGATGGNSYWEGEGNPVSFEPFFDDLNRRLRNQYELGFSTRFNGKPQVETMKLKLQAPGSKTDAPQQVFVYRAGAMAEQ